MSSAVTPLTPSTTPNQPYTILRIKRKRNEEQLDALVVETMRRKKSRGLGVFQYAETVEDGAWDNVEKQQGIQEKISRLATETQQRSVVTTLSAGPVLPSSRDEKVRRYTVVDRDAAPPHPPAAPLQILPSKDMSKQPKSAKDFKLYDAIPAEKALIFQDATDEVDKFLPLLNDYLKIHDINTSDTILPSQAGVISANQPSDDYVWDIFYHRPATLSEWNIVAANVGTLTGLPSELEGYDSLSDSDEEFADEADEDSNAEEYYKNDYPDEEDSDEFHEDSEYEGFMHYQESDDFD